MRITAGMLIAALAFALPAAAQTQAQPAKADVPSSKLWKIEASGIGG